MKVVIAAAGKGTRMGDLAKDKPKHLIEVNGKPFLYYLLENIKQAGFKEVIIIGGYYIEKMNDFLSQYDSSIKLINQHDYIDNESYGTACPVKCVKNIVGNKEFIFLSGDNLFSVKDLIRFKEAGQGNLIAGLKHEEPNNFGVLKVQECKLEEIIEKPTQFVGNLINASLYKFTPEIFNKVEEIEKSDRGEYEITDAINLLAKENNVKVVELEDYWYDFGRPQEIKKLANFLKI